MEALNAALRPLVSWIQQQPGVALLLLLTVHLVTIVIATLALLRGRKLAVRQARMLRGVSGDSLEELLLDYAGNVTAFRANLDRALTTSDANTSGLRQTLRRLGLHRYDAFANVGGLQSFSLALLDEGANGVVISGLYSRQEMRVYAKPIVRGTSDIALTPEELRAISEARLPSEKA